jgi:aryl-alcohol dehydrogenase-like predicted oxidoreductase
MAAAALRHLLLLGALALGCATAASATAGSGYCAADGSNCDAPLPDSAYLTLKNGATICRVLTGMWQLSGGHGYRPEQAPALADMEALVRAGFTTFDLADHYGPAEDFVGAFRAQRREDASVPPPARPLQFHTKWVPQSGAMPVATVRAALDISRQRMKTPTLDLVAFHWWDYGDDRYLQLLESAALLRADGVLAAVSLTNFDTARLRTILGAGVDVVSNQVSFSVVDTRPLDGGMAALADTAGTKLLVYGTLLGGLLSDAWRGAPPPRHEQLQATASLGKYYQFVQAWGSWDLFQELLGAMRAVGQRHGGATIANVAARWVLQQRAVGGVILGMRLGHTAAQHIAENRKVFSFELSGDDMRAIAAVQARGNRLLESIGDCGDEYRG